MSGGQAFAPASGGGLLAILPGGVNHSIDLAIAQRVERATIIKPGVVIENADPLLHGNVTPIAGAIAQWTPMPIRDGAPAPRALAGGLALFGLAGVAAFVVTGPPSQPLRRPDRAMREIFRYVRVDRLPIAAYDRPNPQHMRAG